MAGRNSGKYAKCLVEIESGVLRLVPLNDQGDAELKAFFTADGTDTTVAFTQEDAGRDGYGETSGPYKNLVATVSA